jgi:RNA polymerase sigma factor for flagellar operon FliA
MRDKFKMLERTMIALEARLGRPATETELAQEMQVPEEELRTLHKQWLTTGIVSTDEFTANIDGEDQIRYIDMIVDDNASPEQDFAGNILRENLAASVDKLPDRERLVIALYYYEGLTFKEIGQVLGVSESRVYQLHTQAMGRMKLHMETQGGFYAA